MQDLHAEHGGVLIEILLVCNLRKNRPSFTLALVQHHLRLVVYENIEVYVDDVL
jgi:hypothetical protein